MIGLRQSSSSFQISKSVYSTQSSKKLQSSESVCASADFSIGSSSRSFYMNRVDTDGNSMGSNEYRDEDIPYYRSFDGSSMIASVNEPVMQKARDILVPTELEK